MTETLAERFLRFTALKHRGRKETKNVFRIFGSNLQVVLFHDQSALIFEHNSGQLVRNFNCIDQQSLINEYFEANDEHLERNYPKTPAWRRYNGGVPA